MNDDNDDLIRFASEILTVRDELDPRVFNRNGAVHEHLRLRMLDRADYLVTVSYTHLDPTGDSLHVGHIVPLMMMRWFQKCGHKPLTLVGGATARIGDPSGKDKLRPFLDEQTLAHNVAGLKLSLIHI